MGQKCPCIPPKGNEQGEELDTTTKNKPNTSALKKEKLYEIKSESGKELHETKSELPAPIEEDLHEIKSEAGRDCTKPSRNYPPL